MFSLWILIGIVWITSAWQLGSWQYIASPLFCALLLYILTDRVAPSKNPHRWNPWFTGLLIGLLVSPSLGYVTATVIVVSTWIAMRWSGRYTGDMIHPAAIGLLFGSMLLGIPVSWWVVSSMYWPVLFLLAAAVILYRAKRLIVMLVFLGGYFVFFLLLRGISFSLSQVFDGRVLLFSACMLPFTFPGEPVRRKNLFFVLTAFAWFVFLYVLRYSVTDLLLSAYVAAAICWPWVERMSNRSATKELKTRKKRTRRKQQKHGRNVDN